MRFLTTLRGAICGLFLLGLAGCAGISAGDSARGEAKLEAVPPLPGGFFPLPSRRMAFRAVNITTPSGTWVVNFDDGITKIETSPYVVTKLKGKWYPREGGADAARCLGYQRGSETLVRLVGSSETVSEETWIIFENSRLREVVKYSVPGLGLDPAYPPDAVPYAERVKRQVF